MAGGAVCRDFKLLSFGDDAEEDEAETERVSQVQCSAVQRSEQWHQWIWSVDEWRGSDWCVARVYRASRSRAAMRSWTTRGSARRWPSTCRKVRARLPRPRPLMAPCLPTRPGGGGCAEEGKKDKDKKGFSGRDMALKASRAQNQPPAAREAPPRDDLDSMPAGMHPCIHPYPALVARCLSAQRLVCAWALQLLTRMRCKRRTTTS
jgi:hypothetical protein